jgi:carboxymethylenebutenolidase
VAICEEKSMQDFESDLSSLSAKRNLDRRQMLATSLAVGFAAAVQPVCAQTAITTDSNGLTAGEVKIPVQDGEIPAYRAMPANGGPFPLILVVQEIFGVHEHIKDICRRLAKEGYMAIAAELYARQGSVAGMTDIQEIIGKVVAKVPDTQVMSDLDATAAYAKASGSADTARLGITGFCWGGRITWLYAEHNPAVKAGVAWYGKLVGDPSPLTPKQPIDLVGDLNAPVLGLYGAADTGIPVDTIEKMRSACQAAGKICEFVIYPDTPHAFNADYRPSYREGPAKDGWARMLAWFRSHGVA